MNVEKIFGTRVFDDSAMKKRLPAAHPQAWTTVGPAECGCGGVCDEGVGD